MLSLKLQCIEGIFMSVFSKMKFCTVLLYLKQMDVFVWCLSCYAQLMLLTCIFWPELVRPSSLVLPLLLYCSAFLLIAQQVLNCSITFLYDSFCIQDRTTGQMIGTRYVAHGSLLLPLTNHCCLYLHLIWELYIERIGLLERWSCILNFHFCQIFLLMLVNELILNV